MTSCVRLLRAAGLSAAIMLVLPNCAFDSSGTGAGVPSNFDPGQPQGDAIFCDIERERHCATDEELLRGIRLSEAAVALAEGRTSDVALDDSPEAIAECGGPRAILFYGTFPDGFHVCVNCGGILTDYTDVNGACQRRCYDMFGTFGPDFTFFPQVPPDATTIQFCADFAKPSTNFPGSDCFTGACDAGMLRTDFVDPRRTPEAVVWVDTINSTAEGADSADLRRTAPEQIPPVFDAGAVSQQWITKGDAWLEFGVDPGKTVIAGFSEISGACPPPCPDTDPSDVSIDFGLLVGYDLNVYVQEGGGVLPPGSLAIVGATDRFRVRLRDNGDGTAQVRYTIVIGACTPGMMCNETELYVSTATAHYPLRVDSSVFHANAKITNGRLVRIR